MYSLHRRSINYHSTIAADLSGETLETCLGPLLLLCTSADHQPGTAGGEHAEQ